MEEKEYSVLFLDDEENVLKSVRRVFIDSPYGVMTTTSVDKALEILKQEHIKVVLSDHRMPKVSGVEFLREVKEQYPDVIRILFTGYAEFSAAEDAINLSQVYRFVSKPWNTAELKRTVTQAVEYYDLVTENRSLYEEARNQARALEELNGKLKSRYETQREFNTTVLKQLKAPLDSVKAGLDQLLQKASGRIEGDGAETLRQIKDQLDRVVRFIANIFDLMQMENNETEFHMGVHEMKGFMDDVVAACAPLAKEKGLTLKVEGHEDLPRLSFDAERIRRVIENLVENAVKFTDKGGITISCVNNPEGNHVQICVADTGCGMDDKVQQELFKKFQKPGDLRDRSEGATLGLPICKEIITRHGGRIWCESEVDRGSCFYFVLPIKERRIT